MPDAAYTLTLNDAPADPDLLELIAAIDVDDNAALASAFRLRVPIGLDDDGEWTQVADTFPPLMRVVIGVQFGPDVSETLLTGYITSHRIHFDKDVSASYLDVLGMDDTVLMNLEEKIVAWTNMADSDIVTQIFGLYDFIPDVESTLPSYVEDEVTVIQRGTDLGFVRRLAQRNAFEFFLETDATTGLTTAHFHRPRLTDKPQKDLALAFEDESNVKALDVHYDALRPTTVEARGVVLADKSERSAVALAASLDALGADALLDVLNRQPKTLLSRTGAFDDVELQARTQAAVDASSWAVSLSGELDVTAYQGVLRAGRTVLVKGIGSAYSGEYYVARVRHALSPNEYTQRFELTRNALALRGDP